MDRGSVGTHPDSGLGQVGPGGDLLAGGHVRVAVPGEVALQLLQLLAGEVGALAPLPATLAGLALVRRLGPGVLARRLDGRLCWGRRRGERAEIRKRAGRVKPGLQRIRI